MLSDSTLIDLVRRLPISACYKEADTGRYIVNNLANSQVFGIESPDKVVGLTIRDLPFNQQSWGKRFGDVICRMDFAAQESKQPTHCRQRFLDGDGNARLEAILKIPVLGMRRNVIGIVTIGQDCTREYTPTQLYQLYRYFYAAPDAVRRVLLRLNLNTLFVSPPSDIQFRVLLYRAERYSTKEIARFLGLSPRTVDCHLRALRNKIFEGDLLDVLRQIMETTASE